MSMYCVMCARFEPSGLAFFFFNTPVPNFVGAVLTCVEFLHGYRRTG
jgi:hypothetical protein